MSYYKCKLCGGVFYREGGKKWITSTCSAKEDKDVRIYKIKGDHKYIKFKWGISEKNGGEGN